MHKYVLETLYRKVDSAELGLKKGELGIFYR